MAKRFKIRDEAPESMESMEAIFRANKLRPGMGRRIRSLVRYVLLLEFQVSNFPAYARIVGALRKDTPEAQFHSMARLRCFIKDIEMSERAFCRKYRKHYKEHFSR